MLANCSIRQTGCSVPERNPTPFLAAKSNRLWTPENHALKCAASLKPSQKTFSHGKCTQFSDEPRVLRRAASSALTLTLLVFAPAVMLADDVVLECQPRTFDVLPGEPIRSTLTVRSPSAAAFRLHVPGHPLLKLRATEKWPVKRDPTGTIIYKWIVVWQGLEPGTATVSDLSVKTKKQTRRFPKVTITIRDPGP